ncbi:MAG: CerR family C-terminal domain-containing protein [Rubripirellula sp.]
MTDSLAHSGSTKTPPPTRNAGEKEANTRSRLLAAAGPVFANRGFDGATVREICAAAEVNIALVGYHFGDKMGLYRQVVQNIRDSRAKRFPAPDTEGESPQKTLFKLVQTLLARMLTPEELDWETRILLREMQSPTPVFESIVQEFFRPLFEQLVDTLQELVGDEACRHTLEQLAFSTVGQCLYYRVGTGVVQILIPAQRREGHYDINSLGRHITAVMLAATENAAILRKQDEIKHWSQ